MDGSFASLPVDASPAPRCEALDVIACSACENAIKYYETTTTDESGKEPRPAKAVYNADDPDGRMFSLHGEFSLSCRLTKKLKGSVSPRLAVN